MSKITESHRIAIMTKYLGPTNTRGSRYKAFTESGRSITIAASDTLSSADNHKAAALALQAKMGWTDDLIEGGVPGGYVYVADPRT